MKHHFSAELQPIGIDEKAGIIRGAVACQAGLEARGHGLITDRVLLNQLLMSAKAKGDKIPVHLDHKSGAAGCIGTAQNFRLDGDKLRCDLHFFRTHDKFQQTMEMLSALHETAGLSASFVGDAQDGKARCRDFLAADVVIFPAAVANGLFSALDENSDHPETENEEDNMEGMNTEDIGELIHELLDHVEDLTAHIEQIEAENAALAEALGVHQGDEEEEPVISEKGARSGPNDYGALDVRTFDFESLIEENRRAGMDAKKAHIEALKTFSRQKYAQINL